MSEHAVSPLSSSSGVIMQHDLPPESAAKRLQVRLLISQLHGRRVIMLQVSLTGSMVFARQACHEPIAGLVMQVLNICLVSAKRPVRIQL